MLEPKAGTPKRVDYPFSAIKVFLYSLVLKLVADSFLNKEFLSLFRIPNSLVKSQIVTASWLINNDVLEVLSLLLILPIITSALIIIFNYFYFLGRDEKKAPLFFRIMIFLTGFLYFLEVYSYFILADYPLIFNKIRLFLFMALVLYLLLLLVMKFGSEILHNLFDLTNRSLLIFFPLAINLAITFLIGYILPRASQINTIIIDLYERPINLFFFFGLAPIAAFLFVHYPKYFYVNNRIRELNRSKWAFMGMGIVYHRYRPLVEDTRDSTILNLPGQSYINTGNYNYFLQLFACGLLSVAFFMIIQVAQSTFSWAFDPVGISIAFFLLLAIWLFRLKSIKDKWYTFFTLCWFNFSLYSKVPVNLIRGSFQDTDFTLKRDIYDLESKKLVLDKPRFEEALKVDYKGKSKSMFGLFDEFIVLLSLTMIPMAWLILELVKPSPYNYSELVVKLSIVVFLLISILFVYAMSLRTSLKYFFYNPSFKLIQDIFLFKLEADSQDKIDKVNLFEERLKIRKQLQEIIDLFFEKYHPIKVPRDNFFCRIGVAVLSNDFVILCLFAVFGGINFLFLIALNFLTPFVGKFIGIDAQIDFLTFFNSLIVILMYTFFFYGVIIILIKNFFYYQQKQTKLFSRIMVFIFLLIAPITLFIKKNSKDSFNQINPIKREVLKELDLNEFLEDRRAIVCNGSNVYVAASGGGLKANLWLNTVLNQLQKESDGEFLEHTIGISGVSGGAIGIMTYTSSDDLLNFDKRDSILNEISKVDFVSNDLIGFLGLDALGYNLGLDFGRLKLWNRASKSMRIYSKLTGDTSQIYKKSFRGRWKEIYLRNDRNFPIIISNTTNVEGGIGIAMSVKIVDVKSQNLMYSGSDNILEISRSNDSLFILTSDLNTSKSLKDTTQYTLSYLDAFSTSNRFPVLSSAAKIKDIGYFNDGGIFDNSALLSTLRLFRTIENQIATDPFYFEKDSVDQKRKHIFVTVTNDKSLFERQLVSKVLNRKRVNEVPNGQTGALFRSVATTQGMPRYLRAEINSLEAIYPNIEIETIEIYLPHKLELTEILDKYINQDSDELLGLDNVMVRKLDSAISSNNEQIGHLLRTFHDSVFPKHRLIKQIPQVDPPMSRTLTIHSYNYLKAMLNHPDVKAKIDQVNAGISVN